jgi:uncharacterized phiE125 gp8 family phage protein
MLLQLITAPAVEPVTLPEAKAHLRVLHSAEDTLIEGLVKAARIHIEATTGRALVTQTWDFWLPAFPVSGVVELPKPPLQTVTWVKYRDLDGVEQTLDAADYLVVAPGLIGTVELAPDADWPATQTRQQAIAVRFVAGYGAAADSVPADLRAALLLMAEHLYYNRGAVTAENLKATPMGVDALLGPHRTFGWGPSQLVHE